MIHPWSHKVRQHNTDFGRSLLLCFPCTRHWPFLAVYMTLGSATGLCIPISCATTHVKPLCRGSLTAGSQENPPHVQERKCWEPGPKSRWASWSCFRRSFMEAWRMGQKNSVAAHQAFQTEASFRTACVWAQTCPSLPVLAFAFPSLLSPLHLLPQAEAAHATSPPHLYTYFHCQSHCWY